MPNERAEKFAPIMLHHDFSPRQEKYDLPLVNGEESIRRAEILADYLTSKD
jgi:hypothetical protein